MKVYVVTSGTYSDYTVDAIFSTQKKADQYRANRAAAEATDFNDTWVCELDEGLKEKKYQYWYLGLMLDDGSIEKWGAHVSKGTSTKWGVPRNRIDVCKAVPGLNNRPAVRIESIKFEQHALKLAAETRQKWLRDRTTVSKRS